MKLPHQKSNALKMENNPRVYKILNWIADGSKEWIEWDEKDRRDRHSQRSYKKFRKKQYKIVEKSYI